MHFCVVMVNVDCQRQPPRTRKGVHPHTGTEVPVSGYKDHTHRSESEKKEKKKKKRSIAPSI